MIGFVTTFWMYLRWSVEFLFAPPFAYVSLVLVVNLAASVIRQRRPQTEVWKRTYPILIWQAALLCLALAVAVGGRVDWQKVPFPGPNRWGLRIEDAIDLSAIVVGGHWIWKMEGLRWFALSLTMVQLLLLVSAGFVAGMSLTGTWL